MCSKIIVGLFLGIACATTAIAQTEWIVEPGGPVLAPAPAGSWDHGSRFIQAVIKVDGVYHMFYRGQSEVRFPDLWLGPYSIGHATSADGIAWTLDPANPVLSPGSEDDWDRGSIRGAAVIHDGSQFRMWYASVTPSETSIGLDAVWHGIGYATSTDGSTWSKSVENPIVRPGSEGTGAIPQTVIFDGERYRMWHTSSFGCNSWGLPVSSHDAMNWVGFPPPSLCPDSRLPPIGLSVGFAGSRFVMMKWSWGYFPWTWGAASANGSSWSDFVDYPLIEFAASPALLVDGDTLVMWYTSYEHYPEDGIYRATSTCCSTTYTWFVLAAASGAGASNSFYQTELEVNNAGEERADYRFAWFPRDRDNSEWIRSSVFQIEAGKSVRYADVLAEVFGLGPGSFGALAVEATTEDVLVAARIWNSNGQGAGAYGQDVPVVRVDEFYSGRFPGQRILLGRENADERFNITCFYGRDWYRRDPVEFDLFDLDGTYLGAEWLTLQPFGSHQLNRIFADRSPVEGYVQVRGGWGTYCFGSRIDNRTNDPTTVLPK